MNATHDWGNPDCDCSACQEHATGSRAPDPACPGCGMRAQVEPSRKEPGRWMCHGCAWTFDVPATRSRVPDACGDPECEALCEPSGDGYSRCAAHATPKRVTNAELRREAERLAPFSPRARPHATPDRAAKYRKRPVVIEAMKWIGRNTDEVFQWLQDGGEPDAYMDGMNLVIPTLEGDHAAQIGDFIIKGVQGEFYPCKPDIFEATYEPA